MSNNKRKAESSSEEEPAVEKVTKENGLQSRIAKGKIVSESLYQALCQRPEPEGWEYRDYRPRDKNFQIYIVRELLYREDVSSTCDDLYERLDRALCAWLRLMQYRVHLAEELGRELREKEVETDVLRMNVPANVEEAIKWWPMRATDWTKFARCLLVSYLNISNDEWVERVIQDDDAYPV